MGQASPSRRWVQRRSRSFRAKPKPFPDPRGEGEERLTLSPSGNGSQWDINDPLLAEYIEESSIPSENIGAIRLLESLLSMPETADNEASQRIRQRIDENRLSDRKFFS